MHDDWRFAWDILHALLTVAIAIYAYAADRHRAHRDQLEALRVAHEKRLSELEQRFAAADERMKHLPTGDEVLKLTAGIREIQAEIRATMPLVNVRLERIEEYLHERRLRA